MILRTTLDKRALPGVFQDGRAVPLAIADQPVKERKAWRVRPEMHRAGWDTDEVF